MVNLACRDLFIWVLAAFLLDTQCPVFEIPPNASFWNAVHLSLSLRPWRRQTVHYYFNALPVSPPGLLQSLHLTSARKKMFCFEIGRKLLSFCLWLAAGYDHDAVKLFAHIPTHCFWLVPRLSAIFIYFLHLEWPHFTKWTRHNHQMNTKKDTGLLSCCKSGDWLIVDRFSFRLSIDRCLSLRLITTHSKERIFNDYRKPRRYFKYFLLKKNPGV